MNIRVNGKEEHIEAVTLMVLVEERGLMPEKVVVEYNCEVIPRDKWQEITLKDNDNIEIISFVGGG